MSAAIGQNDVEADQKIKAILRVYRWMQQDSDAQISDIPPFTMAYFAQSSTLQILKPLLIIDRKLGMSERRMAIKYGISRAQAISVTQIIGRRGW